jgi:3-deoxy-D-manno-octulosonic-acid transferase
MWLLYQLGLGLLLLAGGPILLLLKGGHYRQTLRGRLTVDLPEGERGALWVHAVSVGEVNVAATLARGLPAATPLLVTTITPTGQERARRAFAGRATVAYLPFDLGPPLSRFFGRVAPAAVVLVEGDYWPLMLARCHAAGIAVAVVNGRVGDRTFRRLGRWPALARPLLDNVARFGAQTAEDARRLTALGVPADRVTVTGNLKYEAPPPAPLPALEAEVERLAGGRAVLVAGSTMPGEEALVLDAFAGAGGRSRALLVLAPRHPERFADVGRLLAARGLPWLRRSALHDEAAVAAASPPAVLLLDSLGELAALYRLATACFVGGTLVPAGGHNPLEPARFGRPIAVGPAMDNFRDMAEQFDAAHAWRRVGSATDLGVAWDQWLRDPAAAAAGVGVAAQRLVEANQGALERTLALLAPLLAATTAAAPPAAITPPAAATPPAGAAG